MRRWLILGAMVLALAACSDPGEKLYETAQFEEQQFNEEHARKLYREILEKHPDSPYAAQARERLEALEGAR